MQKKKLRILFNDAHSNLPWQNQIPQGGPARFARVFSNYFMREKDIELMSLLFTHNEENQKIFWRKRVLDRNYYELVYPRDKILSTYKKNYTKKQFLNFLDTWLNELKSILKDARPNIVFLNGFNLSNWMLMEAAYTLKIAIVIQHAGIWKRELSVSQDHFSSSTKRIFANLEKEIVQKATHQIFLNEFSRNVFIRDHNIKKVKDLKNKSSIIPLPVDFSKIKKIQIKIKDQLKIGIVARWDSIKNHAAINRLSMYSQKSGLPYKISVVTKFSQSPSKFKERYCRNVEITPPMEIKELNSFIDSQDLILIPSRFDVSPTIFLEALGRGKIVLLSLGVGWADLYKKFGLENLIFSPSASGKKIVDLIDFLQKNKLDIVKKFEKMQRFVFENNESSSVLNNYKRIFKSIYHVRKK